MTPEARTVAVWQDRVRLRVLTAGRGPAVVYFHGPWGLTWDPFLDALAERFTVHAIEHPGTSPGRPRTSTTSTGSGTSSSATTSCSTGWRSPRRR